MRYRELIETTLNFDAWFAGSKVVDKQGQPLIVYHGTNRDFEVFDIESRPVNRLHPETKIELDRPGMYFTSHEPAAYSYASATKRKTGEGRPRIVGAYLKMLRPLDITNMIKTARSTGMTFGDAKRAAWAKFDPTKHDGIIFKGNSMNHSEYVVFNNNQIWPVK